MSIIRYTLQVENDSFSETDIFLPVKDTLEAAALIEKEVLKPLRASRERLGLPQIDLASVEIVNPYRHKHTWRKTYQDKYACKTHYVCQRCNITGWKRLHLFNGEGLSVTRDTSYHASKYEYCCDPLQKLPREIKFSK